MNECCEKMEKYCLQYGITQHHLELLLEYSKSHSYLPDSLQITLKNAVTNGLVYEIYQRCKHHGKLATIQLILCLLNKKYDNLLQLNTRELEGLCQKSQNFDVQPRVPTVMRL